MILSSKPAQYKQWIFVNAICFEHQSINTWYYSTNKIGSDSYQWFLNSVHCRKIANIISGVQYEARENSVHKPSSKSTFLYFKFNYDFLFRSVFLHFPNTKRFIDWLLLRIEAHSQCRRKCRWSTGFMLGNCGCDACYGRILKKEICYKWTYWRNGSHFMLYRR